MIAFRSRTQRLLPVLGSLASLAIIWAIVVAVASPGSLESQAARALGCRTNAKIVLLRLNYDGTVRWPDDHVCSVQESVLLLPSWCTDKENTVVAVVADKDVRTALALPLLAAAHDSGIYRAVLALPDGTDLKVVTERFASGRK